MLELSDDNVDRAKKVAYLALSRQAILRRSARKGNRGVMRGRIMSRQEDTGVHVVGNVLDHLHSLVFDGV